MLHELWHAHVQHGAVEGSCALGKQQGSSECEDLPAVLCVRPAQELGCYKVILDCSEDNVPFYEKCGLTRKEVQMVK